MEWVRVSRVELSLSQFFAYLHPRIPACAKMGHNEVHSSVNCFHQPCK